MTIDKTLHGNLPIIAITLCAHHAFKSVILEDNAYVIILNLPEALKFSEGDKLLR